LSQGLILRSISRTDHSRMARASLVFIPGAWHSPEHFSPLMSRLTKFEYHCTGTALPSTGSLFPLTSFQSDVEAIRKVVLAELDRGQNVVLVTHSYGAVPGASALRGLSTKDRTAAGCPTSVVALAMVCSFIAPAGISLLDLRQGRERPAWHAYHGDLLEVGPPGPESLLYHDIPSAEASHWASLIRPWSWKVIESKSLYSAWQDIPTSYLLCRLDRMIPPSFQEKMIQAVLDSGTQIRVEEVQSSHSPFYSRPEQTAEFIRRAAGESLPSK
jgi:pimeloyl-ACP methyl ester carboxylesterase